MYIVHLCVQYILNGRRNKHVVGLDHGGRAMERDQGENQEYFIRSFISWKLRYMTFFNLFQCVDSAFEVSNTCIYDSYYAEIV